MSNAVETVALSKRFVHPRGLGKVLRGKVPRVTLAVDNISLSIQTGEILGLVGPNGAGKTTFVSLLCTLVIPTAGVAQVGGRDIVTDPAGVRRLVGLVTSNERSFYWRLTGRQNLHFFANLYRLPYRNVAGWIKELLDALDLQSYADNRFDSYSTGIRQRLALARALLHRPRVLFMDEPTKGLDPVAAAGFIQLIHKRIVNAWNPTIIITSHNLSEIEQLCQRIAIMNQGRILRCDSLDALRRSVCAHEKYRLIVGKLRPGCLQTIAAIRGVWGIREAQENGHVDLEVQLARSGGVLATVLRTIIADGGEVYHCSEVPVSLQEVFSRTVLSTGKR